MTDRKSSSRVLRLTLSLEARVVNPLVERILRSRFHGLLSGHLLLLSYEGRVSRTRITTPLLYEPIQGDFVVTTVRGEATWWRNFRGGYPATALIRGEPIDVRGVARTEPLEVAVWLRELATRSCFWRLVLRHYGVDQSHPPDRLEAAAETFVFVRFQRV